MAFNFPGGAVVGQEYVTGAGITYVWNGYGWNVKAQIQEAPQDNKIYGRKNAAWAEVISDVTKAYVDAEVLKQVPRAGGVTMTGDLGFASNRINFAYVGSQPSSGPAVKWTDGTNTNVIGLYINAGLVFQGNSTNNNFKVTAPTTDGTMGAVRVTLGSDGVVLGSQIAAYGRGFDPNNVDLASLIATSASYGGGMTLIDGSWRATLYASGSNMVLATGNNPPATKLTLQSDNNHQLVGTLTASGDLKARGNVLRMAQDDKYLYWDGTNWNLNPSHLYTAAGRVLGTNDGSFGNYLPLGGGNMTGLLSTRNSIADIGYGGCAGGIQVLSNNPTEPSITFHRQGAFAMNFGMDNNCNLSFGGWSHGGNRWQLWSQRDFNYTPANLAGCTFTGAIHCNSTISSSGNVWAHGGHFYGSPQGHDIYWDGGNWVSPHGSWYIGNRWVAREGGSATFTDCYTSSNMHSNGNHYFMAGDGVWFRWRGDLGRTDTSHGLYIGTVHQTQGPYAEGYYQKGGVSGGFEGARFNIANGGPAFHFWSEDSNYGAIYMGSDYRIKKEVKALPSTWEKVKRLRPVSFKLNGYGGFRADGVERWGFIAHELQDALIPSVANGKKDAKKEIQAPWPMAVIAPITKALQEAMERIEQLERKLNV